LTVLGSISVEFWAESHEIEEYNQRLATARSELAPIVRLIHEYYC
jgi:hypothetical protein